MVHRLDRRIPGTRHHLSAKNRKVHSDGAARVFYRYGAYSTYEKLMTFHKQHLHRMISQLDSRALGLDDLIGQNTLFFLQTLLRRSLRLLLGTLQSVKYENFLAAALNVRAHFEVTAAAGYLLNQLNKYYRHDIEKRQMEELLTRLSLGRRYREQKYPYESINVLTMIDEADKVFSVIAEQKSDVFRDSYEWLSEFCHPNAYGLISRAKTHDKKVVSFPVLRESQQREYDQVEYILISLPMFLLFFDKATSLVSEHERMPALPQESTLISGNEDT